MNPIHIPSVVALTVALLFAGCGPAGADDLTPTPSPVVPVVVAAPLVVMTLNVHGGTDRKGGGNAGRVADVAADVLAVVVEHEPAVVALQELCGRQYRGLRSRLVKLGYAGAFTSTQRAKGCNDRKHGNLSGIGIFVRGSIQSRYVWALPWGANAKGVTGRQPRRLLCVKPRAEGWRACVTHLSPHAPDVLNQAGRVAAKIGRWQGRVVLAGDFNLNGKWVAASFPAYSVAGSGIDHVVSSSPGSVVAVVPVASSDHPALIGSVGEKE